MVFCFSLELLESRLSLLKSQQMMGHVRGLNVGGVFQ